MRSKYVYRLRVAYPPFCEQGKPRSWFIPHPKVPDGYDPDRFRWPRERMFLSERAAHNRAYIFKDYGCRVRVERSAPLEWDQWDLI